MNLRFAFFGELLQSALPSPWVRWWRRMRAQCRQTESGISQSQLSDLLTWFALDTEASIVIADRRAIVQWVNPAFTRLTGFEPAEVIGKRIGLGQHGIDTDHETLDQMRRALLHGEPFAAQIVHYTKQGQSYWVDIESRPIRSSSGEVEHFIFTQRDITQQRTQTEQIKQAKTSAEQLASDLSSSRQQLRMAVEAGGLSLWDWDLAGDRFWISSSWVPIANEQWIANCGLWDLFMLAHEDDHPRIRKTINQLLTPAPQQIDEQFRMLIAGAWRWVNFRGAVSARDQQGNPTRVSGTLLDETDRKHAEDRAQADRDLLQCVIGHIPHAVFWKDAERRYMGCNRKFAQSLGLESEEQVIGRIDQELYRDPSEAQRIADSDQAIITEDREIIDQQVNFVSYDGDKCTMVCSKVPLRHPNGSVFGMLGVFNDITVQKRLERQLADARQLESLGRLAAGVAHEINTPMQYISDNVEFLSESTSQVFELIDQVQAKVSEVQENAPSKNTNKIVAPSDQSLRKLHFIREQVPKAIKDCLVGSRRVMEIVTAMKVFTHPGTNGYVLANINDLIVSTTSITRNRWKYCAQVELELEEELPQIRCLPAELNQVILNLLINAVDAVVERFGTTDKPKGLIILRTRRVSGGITIEVADNGCGIPEDNASRIFDPFFTTKGVGKGTGQGLTLCYGVVSNKHSGTLTFESTLGEGTTFRVFLPDAPCPASSENAPHNSTQDCLC